MKYKASCMFFLLLPLLMVGCSDYSFSLPNGYKMVRTNATEVVLSTLKGDVILSDIRGYNVQNEFVLGYAVTRYDNKPAGWEVKRQTGFFVLNTRTGKLLTQLTSKEFAHYLETLDLRIPKLEKP